TALKVAIQAGNKELLRYLLNKGVDINNPYAKQRGKTALRAASTAIGGYIGIACLLLDKGTDINAAVAKEQRRTALEGVAEHGRIDMIQLLLNAGAELKGSGKAQYERAVKLARSNGHYATARLIQSHCG
ncbi:ankyrin, partial [Cenococcum geophilum 1.58]|uniref:ankyrin n=1 Tax=Cenococcum geophilum 1.58 TaxID=794803 RepID=UPI00358F9E5E